MPKPNKRKNEEQLKQIGERLKWLREQHGLTQEESSRILGVGPSTVGHLEKGRREISVAVLYKASIMYRVTTDYILGLEKKPHSLSSGLNKSDDPQAIINRREQIIEKYPEAFSR